MKRDETYKAQKVYKMVEQGFILAPSQFEGIFISYAHTQEDFDKTLKAIEIALKECFQ